MTLKLVAPIIEPSPIAFLDYPPTPIWKYVTVKVPVSKGDAVTTENIMPSKLEKLKYFMETGHPYQEELHVDPAKIADYVSARPGAPTAKQFRYINALIRQGKINATTYVVPKTQSEASRIISAAVNK